MSMTDGAGDEAGRHVRQNFTLPEPGKFRGIAQTRQRQIEARDGH
jgi:hypothetical protein